MADLAAELGWKDKAKMSKGKNMKVPVGTLLFGPARYKGAPALGDFGIGLVSKVPTPLDNNYDLRFMWRNPVDGQAVAFLDRLSTQTMAVGLYLKLRELDGNGQVRLDRPLPKGYTEADVELLRRDLKFEVFTPKLTETHAAAIRRAGFELEHAREMWS